MSMSHECHGSPYPTVVLEAGEYLPEWEPAWSLVCVSHGALMSVWMPHTVAVLSPPTPLFPVILEHWQCQHLTASQM